MNATVYRGEEWRVAGTLEELAALLTDGWYSTQEAARAAVSVALDPVTEPEPASEPATRTARKKR